MKIMFIISLFFSLAVSAQVLNPDLPHSSLLTKKYLEQLSKREVGQDKFVIKTRNYRMMPMARGAANAEGAGGGARDIQESDVFKLGKKDKKELFLLNRYRGFQIVSFDKGLEQPRIVGRFPIYNNWNSEMYFIESLDQVVVINTEWTYQTNRWETNYNTTLYLIDVSRSEQPKLITQTSLQGYLQESRMVGDVLYAITNNGNWSEMKAEVTSVKIEKDSIETVDKEELHGPQGWVGSMNVVKEGAKYFIISTLTKWGNVGDSVNVHDITSEKGQIEKLFTAKARGQVRERSETFIHKDHLFIVSNYRANESSPLRVSVEAMPMKKNTSIVVSAENMRVSVGDTNGLHASLQDVRVSGDLLYAFWVPANNIDPFELFDISEPSKGIKHLGQLQFEGWISKAFPLEHQNKKYVLGLGWIVPATSETNKRYPQAKLFEIKQDGTNIKHEVVASLTISSEEMWASLNDLDKFFEMIEEAPGIYNILFPVTFRKNWQSGGKMISVNLNDKTILEGANIVADQSWLSRVFVNKEIHAINAFSYLSLATFDQQDLVGTNVAKTVSVLELARNIIDFKILPGQMGLQIINSDKKVELRHVSLDLADAEKNQVINTMVMKGNYHWHAMKKNKLYIITSVNKTVERGSDDYRYQTEVFDSAFLNVVDLKTLVNNVQKIDLTRTRDENSYYNFNPQSVGVDDLEVITIGDEFFRLREDSLVKLNVEEGCHYFFNSELNSLKIKMIGKDLYAYNTFKIIPTDGVRSDDRAENNYAMPFMKKLSLSDDKLLCTASINIPGEPVMVDENFVVAKEAVSYPFHRFAYGYSHYHPRPNGNTKTFSLKLNSEEATMVDILNKEISSGIFEGGFVTYTPSESRVDLWNLLPTGEFYSRPEYLDFQNSTNTSLISIQKFNNRNFIFMKNNQKVDLFEIGKSKKIVKVPVTSPFDQNVTDGSAEYIFAIENMEANDDLSRIFISQGHHGVTEIILK